MTIEMGARSGIVAPDATTLTWLKGRPKALQETAWQIAIDHWHALQKDDNARFEKEVSIRADSVLPMVTRGTAPDQVTAVTGFIPIHDVHCDALLYMGLSAGQAICNISIDQAFIGPCTNGRFSDLLAASYALKNRKVRVPLLISPDSMMIANRVHSAGLVEIFKNAGATWASSGCSLCVGMNGDLIAPKARCAPSSNCNFRGRQGPAARTHLMSPAMVAAAAVAGRLVDVRAMGGIESSSSSNEAVHQN